MKKLVLLSALAVLPMMSHAAVAGLSGPVTGWRLQNYVGGQIQIWYTQAQGTCGGTNPAGKLVMPSSSTTEERNRLWSVVETARATNRNVYIDYDTSTCAILSFALDN